MSNIHDDEPAFGLTSMPNSDELTSITSQTNPPSCGLRNSLHGNAFQLKLLMLFLIRGIEKSYKFELATEMPGLGGKFDDLIFKYQQIEESTGNIRDCYRYLQAKHKQDESIQITAAQLLKDNEGDFSLAKYFRSYCRAIKRQLDASQPDSVQDCIICTNIGIDTKDLEGKGIELVDVSPPITSTQHPNEKDILAFENVSEGKRVVWYKLKSTANLRQKMREWSVVHSLANLMFEIALTDGKKLELRNELLKRYHVSLFKEGVLVRRREMGIIHPNFFIKQNEENEVMEQFRNILSNITFVHYCKNLTFSEDTKKRRKVIQKQLKDFNGQPLLSLQKYSKKMEWNFDVFDEYREVLVKNNVITIHPKRGTRKKIKFSREFELGISTLSAEVLTFRTSLSCYFFAHFWRDLTFHLSESFGQSNNSNQTVTVDNQNLLDNLTKEEDIETFLEKLIFVVNTPNEVQLGKILEKEIGKYYKVVASDFQSSYILKKMLDWFKAKDSKWYSSAKGTRLLKKGKQKMKSFRATSLSLDYQKELKDLLSFSDKAVKDTMDKLKLWLLDDPLNLGIKLQVKHITTESPKLTAVKVIAALRGGIAEQTSIFERDDSYLLTLSSRLKRGRKKEWIRNALIKKGNPQELLVVVHEDNAIFHVVESNNENREESLFRRNEMESLKGKKIIVIGKANSNKDHPTDDTIAFEQLSDISKNRLLSRAVSFQRSPNEDSSSSASDEKNLTVGQLIGTFQHGNVLDVPSIEELVLEGELKTIEIPPYSATSFDQALYVKRRVQFDFNFDDTFWRKSASELEIPVVRLRGLCRIDSETGIVKWMNEDMTNEDLKKGIWDKIIEKTRRNSSTTTSENHLINEGNLPKRVVIISGVAGTGKSTLLSHFYEEIKRMKPTTWVIRINLTDHQKALKEIIIVDNSRLALFHFLIQLPSGLVAGSSQFARSLLKRRLETGDNIVLMLDGFDEIDRKCQEKTIQLIKSILNDKTGSIGLYMTTRHHMADDLQFELGQLAYSLDDFSKQDRIDCLTSFWKASLKVGSDGKKEIIDVVVNEIATLLVDRVTSTLQEKEKSFIGVPLQCRIVAECFLSHIQELVSAQIQLDPSTAGRASDENLAVFPIMDKLLVNFSFVSLYRLLLEKKREIYRQEKVKAHKAESHCVDKHVDRAMAGLEKDLIQLAIKTIVSNQEDANVLLRRKDLAFQSDADQEEEESIRDSDGIRFGLLDETRANTRDQVTTIRNNKKVVFLHRTYAEYFVADFLYKGFALDDRRHNKLLNNESVRRFIITDILAGKDEYNGVQTFLNSMLGEVVGKNEEWRDRINRRSLPERFCQFTSDIISPQVSYLKEVNALYFSVYHRRDKIFLFLCDCLDATRERKQIQQTIKMAFLKPNVDNKHTALFNLFCKRNKHGQALAEVFSRFLSYVIDNEEVPVPFATKAEHGQYPSTDRLSPGDKPYPITKVVLTNFLVVNIIAWDFHESYWNAEEQREILFYLLQFFETNRISFNQMKHSKQISSLLSFFVWNEHYHGRHLQTFLNLLSKTELYLDDDVAFAKLIARSTFDFKRRANWIVGRIDKTLAALRDLNRLNVAIKVARSVLGIEPEAIRGFYRQGQLQTTTATRIVDMYEDDVGGWLQWLLERDEVQMTQLHLKALCNEKESVKGILDRVALIWLSPIEETQAAYRIKNLAQQVVNLMARDVEGFTPLYVAIVRSHEEICDMILSFLNRVLDKDQLKKDLTTHDGFLRRALRNAIGDENIARVKLIFESVKRQLGHNCLLDLLKSDYSSNYQKSLFFSFFLDSENMLSPAVVEIVVSIIHAGRERKDYNQINDLVFGDKDRIQILERIDVDTLRKMLSADGVGKWTRQLLDKNINRGFRFLLSRKLLQILIGDELDQLLEAVTGKENERRRSYWVDFEVGRNDSDLLSNFFRILSTHQEINVDLCWIRKLVLPSDDEDADSKGQYKGMIRLKTLVSAALAASLSQELMDEVILHAQKTIQDILLLLPITTDFSKPESSNLPVFAAASDSAFGLDVPSCHHLSDSLHFYLDYGSDEQLKEFVNVVTNTDRYWKDKRRCSIWKLWWNHYRSNNKKTVALLKRLSLEKAAICGPQAVKTLLVHDHDEAEKIPFVLRVALTGVDIHAEIITHLSEENQDEMKDYLRLNVPKLIDKAFTDSKTYFNDTDDYSRLNVLRFFLDYANQYQLKDFVKNITTIKCGTDAETMEYTIWSSVISTKERFSKEDIQMMEQFMESAKEKLGQEAVIQLALQDDGQGAVIGSLIKKGRDDMAKAIIAHLDDVKRQTFQHKLCQLGIMRVPLL